MSDSLLNQLESKLLAVVETIEAQNKEITALREERQRLEDALKQERQILEEKLRGLMGRIDQATAQNTTADSSREPAADPKTLPRYSAGPYTSGGSTS